MATTPAVGSPAPAFSLPATGPESTLSLADFKGRPLVLYFYPKADTPGCTKEACGFRDALASYRSGNVAVLGISPDPIDAVQKFSDKFELTFPLLADADHAVTERYGQWGEKMFMGKTYMGAARTTFVIGPDGKIAHVFESVKPDGHDKEVLAWIEANPL